METQNQSDLCFPELANISCRKSPGPVVFYLVPLLSISILTVVLNLLVITAISHFRQLHTPTNLLLLSLAVTDYLVGLQLIPMAVRRATSCWSLGDRLCSLFVYYVLTVTSTSVGNIVLISVDRYVAICDPLHYNIRVTVKRVQLCVCLCWFSSLSYSGVIYYDQLMQPGKYHSCYGECVIVFDFTTGVVDLVVSFLFPLCSVVMLYTKVFVVAVSQARAMRLHAPRGKLKHSPPFRVKKSELKAARSLGVLVVVFLLCFCPYYGVFLARDSLRNHTLQVCVIYLYYFNSCVNPLIYALFYPWFRRAIKHIVTLRILQPGSCKLNVL
ncbi:trace amine-associated receptor 13c-like [Hippocampus comes]|nr:PREDICTED: trace amine-associated receptor 13c-like [Hippocampus comes]